MTRRERIVARIVLWALDRANEANARAMRAFGGETRTIVETRAFVRAARRVLDDGE